MNMQTKQSNEQVIRNIDYIQVLKNRWREIFLVFLLVMVVAVVVTWLMTPTYMAKSQIQIKPPDPLLNVDMNSGRDPVASANKTPTFMTTQYEVLIAKEVLKRVAKKQRLDEEWKMTLDDAADNLKNMVKISPVRATDLVDIIVSVPKDSRLAKDIAESLPEVYREGREEEVRAKLQGNIDSLKKLVAEQKNAVGEKKALLTQEIKKGYLPSTWSNDERGGGMTANMEDEEFRRASDKAMKLRSDEVALKNHVDQMQSLPDDKLLNYVILNMQGQSGAEPLRRTYTEFSDKQKEKELLIADGLAPKHPRMVALAETTKMLQERLNDELIGLRDTLKTELVKLAADRQEAEKTVEEKREEYEKRVLMMPDYEDARHAYNSARDQLNKFETDLNVEKARLTVPRETIIWYEYPKLPVAPSSPNVTINLAVGAVAGILLGIGLALLLEFMDTSVKTMEDVERALQVPVLGIIPKNVPILHSAENMGPDAEAYRILRTNIEFNKHGLEEVSLTFVSGSAGEGKTTTMSNLAYICAQGGYATLMIDADLRRSKLHRYYELDNSVGLTSYLLDDYPLEEVVFQTPIDNLYVMPAGPTPFDPSGALNSRKFSELLQEVKQRFDIVLVDSPPILGVSDSAVIVSEVDMTLMVVQPHKLPLKALLRQKQVIESVGGNLAGVVMNNVDITTDHQYQYYTTYYSYYATDTNVGADTSKLKKSERSGKAKELASVLKIDSDDLY